MFCRKRTDWNPRHKAISGRTSNFLQPQYERTFEEYVQTGHVCRYDRKVKVDLSPNLPVNRVPGLIL